MLRKLLVGMLAATALVGCAVVPYDEPGYAPGYYGYNGSYGYAGPPAVYSGPAWIGGYAHYGYRHDGDGGHRGDWRRDNGHDDHHFAHDDRDRNQAHHG